MVGKQETDPKRAAGAFVFPAVTLKGLSAIQAPLRPGTESPLVSRTSSQQLMELSALIPSPFCHRQDSVIPFHPAGEHRRILPILAGKEKENRGKQCQRPGDPTLSISSAKANSCLGHPLVRAASNPRELPGSRDGWAGAVPWFQSQSPGVSCCPLPRSPRTVWHCPCQALLPELLQPGTARGVFSSGRAWGGITAPR